MQTMCCRKGSGCGARSGSSCAARSESWCAARRKGTRGARRTGAVLVEEGVVVLRRKGSWCRWWQRRWRNDNCIGAHEEEQPCAVCGPWDSVWQGSRYHGYSFCSCQRAELVRTNQKSGIQDTTPLSLPGIVKMSKGTAANVMERGVLVVVVVMSTRKTAVCENCAPSAGEEISSAPRLSRPIPRGPKVSSCRRCRPHWWL
eukprot:1940657-Amphidinium_carterae.2